MKTHRFASHTAEEQRRLSNLGHLVEGLLLAAVSILAVLGNLSLIVWATTAWPILILVAGVLLLILTLHRRPVPGTYAAWHG